MMKLQKVETTKSTTTEVTTQETTTRKLEPQQETFKVEVEFSIDLNNFDDLTEVEQETLLEDMTADLEKEFAAKNPFGENGRTVVRIVPVDSSGENDVARRRRNTDNIYFPSKFRIIVEYWGSEAPSQGFLFFKDF